MINEAEGYDEITKINALLRERFKIDPDKLNDDEWALRWNELAWVLKQKGTN